MKTKLLVTFFICLSQSVHADNHISPKLEDIHEITEHEVDVLASILPNQTYSFQRWCIMKMSMIMAYYKYYQKYLPTIKWCKNKKNRRKRRT